MQDQINELIISSLSGNESPEEHAFLSEWLLQSEYNRAMYEKVRLTWMATSQLRAGVFKPGTDQKLKEIHRRLNISTGTRHQNEASFNPRLYDLVMKYAKIAAVVVFIFLLGGFISITVYKKVAVFSPSLFSVVEAPIGSRAMAYLPDGTRVWLNAGSKIEYANDFNLKKREVKLTGEGYFKVKTDPAKPFVVSTGGLHIKAWGTAFNVKSYPEEKRVITTLVEGNVEIEGKDLNNKPFTVHLQPRQKVVYFEDGKITPGDHLQEAPDKIAGTGQIATVQPRMAKLTPLVSSVNVKTELYTSWKDDRWIIESEKLNDLSKLFERRFNISISFKNEELKNYRFSGTIQNETLEQILEIMRLTIPLSYKIDKGSVTFDLDRKLKNVYSTAYRKKNH